MRVCVFRCKLQPFWSVTPSFHLIRRQFEPQSVSVLLAAETDCNLSAHKGRKTEMGISTSWWQTHRHCCLYGAALRLFKTLFMKLYNVMIPGGPGQAGSLLLWGMVIDASFNWSSCRKTKHCRKHQSRWRPRIFIPGLCLEGMLR